MRDERTANDASMRVDDEVIDRYLDGELMPDEACDLFEAMRGDAARAREVYAMQRAIHALGEPVRSRDFSRSIIARVHGRRPLLDGRGLRIATMGRIAAAVTVLVTAGAVFTLLRLAPEVRTPGVAPDRDIQELARAVPAETGRAIEQLRSELDSPRVADVALVKPVDAEVSVCVAYSDGSDVAPLGITSADVGVEMMAPEMDPLIAGALVRCGAVELPAAGDVVFGPPADPGAFALGADGASGSQPLGYAVQYGPDGRPMSFGPMGADLMAIPGLTLDPRRRDLLGAPPKFATTRSSVSGRSGN